MALRETQVSQAVRSLAAAVALAHRQLDDGAFLSILWGLRRVAETTGCEEHLSRQINRACRDDDELVVRLAGFLGRCG